MNLLDTRLEKVSTTSWHQVDIAKKQDAEVIEKFGGHRNSKSARKGASTAHAAGCLYLADRASSIDRPAITSEMH